MVSVVVLPLLPGGEGLPCLKEAPPSTVKVAAADEELPTSPPVADVGEGSFLYAVAVDDPAIATPAADDAASRPVKKLSPFISAFSAIRRLRALRPTKVRRMAHVTTLHTVIMMVAASTTQPPHCMWGTKRRISMRKARRVMRRVGKDRIRRSKRKRGECEGERR